MAGVRRLLIYLLVLAAAALSCVGVGVANATTATKPSLNISVADTAGTPLGNAVLKLPYRCSVPKNAIVQGLQLYVATAQNPGTPHEATNGQTYRWVEDGCDGRWHTLKVAVVSWTEAGYRRGHATVTVNASACWWVRTQQQSICVNQDINEAPVWLKAGGRMPAPYVDTSGTFDIAVSKHGHVKGGQATVTVKYVCTVPDGSELFTGSVLVNMRQQVGPLHSAQSFGEAMPLTCDGTYQRSKLTLQGSDSFHRGRTTVDLEGSAGWYNADTDAEGYVNGSVRAVVVTLHR